MWCVVRTGDGACVPVEPGAEAVGVLSKNIVRDGCMGCGSYASQQPSEVVPLCYECLLAQATPLSRLAASNNRAPPLWPFEVRSTESVMLKHLLCGTATRTVTGIIRDMVPSGSYDGVLAVPSIAVWTVDGRAERSILWCLARLDKGVPAHVLSTLDAGMRSAPPAALERYSATPFAESESLLVAAAERWSAWFTGGLALAKVCAQAGNLTGLYAAAAAWPEAMEAATAAVLLHRHAGAEWLAANPRSLAPPGVGLDALTLLVRIGGSPSAVKHAFTLGVVATGPSLQAAVERTSADRLAVAELLIRRGAPMTAALGSAAERGDLPGVQLLLRCGADPNAPDRGIRPLTRSVTSGASDDAMICALLDAGAVASTSLYTTMVAIQAVDRLPVLERRCSRCGGRRRPT